MKEKVLIKTASASVIKVLIESLKEVLTDVNIHFCNKGIKIMSMDGSKIALVHLKLDAEQFEKYYCETPIKTGINMLSFFKLMKAITNHDVLTMFMYNSTD